MSAIQRFATNHLLYDRLFGYIGSGDIIRLGWTCRRFQGAVCDYWPRAFNIQRTLSYFFEDILGFRLLQFRTGAIVSGSVALQFFDRSPFTPSDLDIYVHMLARQEVGEWLLKQGYMYNSYRRVIRLETGEEISIDQPQSYAEAIGSLLNAHIVNRFYVREVLGAIEFVKTVNGKQLTVQVNLVTGCPIGAVLNFHSSELLFVYLQLILIVRSMCHEHYHL